MNDLLPPKGPTPPLSENDIPTINDWLMGQLDPTIRQLQVVSVLNNYAELTRQQTSSDNSTLEGLRIFTPLDSYEDNIRMAMVMEGVAKDRCKLYLYEHDLIDNHVFLAAEANIVRLERKGYSIDKLFLANKTQVGDRWRDKYDRFVPNVVSSFQNFILKINETDLPWPDDVELQVKEFKALLSFYDSKSAI